MASDINDELQASIPETQADDQRRKARLIGWGASVVIHASAVRLTGRRSAIIAWDQAVNGEGQPPIGHRRRVVRVRH